MKQLTYGQNKKDTRDMIDDANDRFNDKVSGMEGYVKRELDLWKKI